MAKLVTKWRYLKPDAARHAQAYIRYIATREGVEKYVEENGARPAVQAQRVLVEKLLRDFPDARRSFEYEDYARRPTVRNASEFITRTLEEHLELFDARSNYVSYIAQRPRVQRSGAHGLFTQEEDAPDLNAAARAVSEHDGNIWTCILSLRREDAARLSYDKADAWRALLRANAAEIAARFNVPVGSFHWCGAFHNEAHHPHVHLSIVGIIQSYGQLERNYGKEGCSIILDNAQDTIAGGFSPAGDTAEQVSRQLGEQTVMTGSVSRGKSDPSRSLQMMGRRLMTPDELKSMPKGQFIVMKTGRRPMLSKLRLFLDWGITFTEPYALEQHAQREVKYAGSKELRRKILKEYGIPPGQQIVPGQERFPERQKPGMIQENV